MFRNLASVGMTAAHLVKLTGLLHDMNDFGACRTARNGFIATVDPPAAPPVTLLEVSGPDFPLEIEAVAAG